MSKDTAVKERRKAPLTTPTDLGDNARKDITGALNALLADVFALYLKTKNFHWHVSGPHFRDYHLLLDEQADQISPRPLKSAGLAGLAGLLIAGAGLMTVLPSTPAFVVAHGLLIPASTLFGQIFALGRIAALRQDEALRDGKADFVGGSSHSAPTAFPEWKGVK